MDNFRSFLAFSTLANVAKAGIERQQSGNNNAPGAQGRPQCRATSAKLARSISAISFGQVHRMKITTRDERVFRLLGNGKPRRRHLHGTTYRGRVIGPLNFNAIFQAPPDTAAHAFAQIN
jgi:hypothetical protein